MLVVSGMVIAACNLEHGTMGEVELVDELDRTVITEHRFREGSPMKKDIGEDCSAYGADECSSMVCLRVGANYACSRECRSAHDCPGGWSCIQTYPGEGSSFCIPPAANAEIQSDEDELGVSP